MNRTAIALSIIVMLGASHTAIAQAKSSCAPDIHYSVKKVKARAAIETAPLPADKAIVYVVRPTHFGALIQTKLAMDGHWMGINKADSYFVFLADPGQHDFCSQAENNSQLSLNLEAGKIYYLQQHVHMGINKARNDLTRLDDASGQVALAKCHRTIFWEKGKARPSD